MSEHVKIFFVTGLFVLLSATYTFAQFGLSVGPSLSNVRHHNLLINEFGSSNNRPLLGYFSGLYFQFYPFPGQEKLSFSFEAIMNHKGYQQQFADTAYVNKLNYLSFPLMVNYDVNEKISIHTGVELSSLLLPVDIFNKNEIYNEFDFGVVLGTNVRLHKMWTVFARMNYGLLPVLNYYKIDALGNITPVKDVRNINLQVGLKLNLIYEKIRFF